MPESNYSPPVLDHHLQVSLAVSALYKPLSVPVGAVTVLLDVHARYMTSWMSCCCLEEEGMRDVMKRMRE